MLWQTGTQMWGSQWMTVTGSLMQLILCQALAGIGLLAFGFRIVSDDSLCLLTVVIAGLALLCFAVQQIANVRKRREGLRRIAELDAQIDVLSKEMEDTREKIRALRADMDALIDQG